jgi:hypothetical protein
VDKDVKAAKVSVLVNLVRFVLVLADLTVAMVDKVLLINLIHKLHARFLLKDPTIHLVKLDLKALEVEVDYQAQL